MMNAIFRNRWWWLASHCGLALAVVVALRLLKGAGIAGLEPASWTAAAALLLAVATIIFGAVVAGLIRLWLRRPIGITRAARYARYASTILLLLLSAAMVIQA
jgi:hypothetical protein